MRIVYTHPAKRRRTLPVASPEAMLIFSVLENDKSPIHHSFLLLCTPYAFRLPNERRKTMDLDDIDDDEALDEWNGQPAPRNIKGTLEQPYRADPYSASSCIRTHREPGIILMT